MTKEHKPQKINNHAVAWLLQRVKEAGDKGLRYSELTNNTFKYKLPQGFNYIELIAALEHLLKTKELHKPSLGHRIKLGPEPPMVSESALNMGAVKAILSKIKEAEDEGGITGSDLMHILQKVKMKEAFHYKHPHINYALGYLKKDAGLIVNMLSKPNNFADASYVRYGLTRKGIAKFDAVMQASTIEEFEAVLRAEPSSLHDTSVTATPPPAALPDAPADTSWVKRKREEKPKPGGPAEKITR